MKLDWREWAILSAIAGGVIAVLLALFTNMNTPKMVDQHATAVCGQFLPYARSWKDSVWLYAWKPKDSRRNCGDLLRAHPVSHWSGNDSAWMQ